LSAVELKNDSTRNFARRYGYLFRLPSTGRALFFASVPLIAVELLARTIFGESPVRIILYSFAVESVLVIGIEIDLLALKGRRKGLASFRRLATVSILSNSLWLLFSLIGLAVYLVSKSQGRFFSLVILGAFFAICFRAIVFGSVFYDKPTRGLPLAIVQPVILLLPVAASTRMFSSYMTNSLIAVAGGIVAIVGIEIYLGLINKPNQGYKALLLLQAFLTAWTAGNPSDLEHYFQTSSEERGVTTEIVRLRGSTQKGNPVAILVVPGIHPGPFSPVGSSNLPGDIYTKLRSESSIPVIFHSISDHDLNLPSKEEVKKYAESLEKSEIIETGKTISIPVVAREGKATASGFALGKTLLITLTLSPYGMEDLPGKIRNTIEEESSRNGYRACLVIDSHNSLGEKPDEIETENLLRASSRVIKSLSNQTQNPFGFGFAHSSEIQNTKVNSDIGPAGVGLLLFEGNGSRFSVVVVDANNSSLGFREKVMDGFKQETSEELLEICTSDTHVTAAKAQNAKGYLALGDVSSPEAFVTLLQSLLEKARSRLSPASYETSIVSSSVRTIGSRVLNNFSGLLDETTVIAKRGAQVFGLLAMLITFAVAML